MILKNQNLERQEESPVFWGVAATAVFVFFAGTGVLETDAVAVLLLLGAGYTLINNIQQGEENEF